MAAERGVAVGVRLGGSAEDEAQVVAPGLPRGVASTQSLTSLTRWASIERRVPDRVVFEHAGAGLVHGSAYERIASPGCSDRTSRAMACIGTSSASKGDAGVTFAPGTSRDEGAYRTWDWISEVRQMPTTMEKPQSQLGCQPRKMNGAAAFACW